MISFIIYICLLFVNEKRTFYKIFKNFFLTLFDVHPAALQGSTTRSPDVACPPYYATSGLSLGRCPPPKHRGGGTQGTVLPSLRTHASRKQLTALLLQDRRASWSGWLATVYFIQNLRDQINST